MSSAAPPGYSRDVSVCPRQLSMEWGFTAVAKKGSELQFEEDKPFYITKGNHRIVSVGLSWYLWAMYRQKYSLGKSRVCLRDEQRFRESAPSPFSHCLYLHCVGGSCMTFLPGLTPGIFHYISKAKMHNSLKLACACYSAVFGSIFTSAESIILVSKWHFVNSFSACLCIASGLCSVLNSEAVWLRWKLV